MKRKRFLSARKFGINSLSRIGIKDRIIDPPSSENNLPIVYHPLNEDIRFLEGMNKEHGKILPNQLIIQRGIYTFFDKDYDLNNEGLYRFSFPLKINQQRIVFEKNIDSLLSAICWISSHGSIDNEKDFSEINKKAENSKISLTCGPIIEWVSSILKNYSIKHRIVSCLTLQNWNSYDDGHIMIEIFRDELKKWILYDLDNNSFFEAENNVLSFIEFFEHVKEGDYNIKYLAPPSFFTFHEKKANYDFNFILESKLSTERLRRNWYKRVMQVPLINNDKHTYFFDIKNKKRVESYSSYYKFLEKETFMKNFY